MELDCLGEKARRTVPRIFHLLLAKNSAQTADEFEQSLFLARRKIEVQAREQELEIYVPSLSIRTISYKGLMIASGLAEFYTDLRRHEYKSALCIFHQRFQHKYVSNLVAGTTISNVGPQRRDQHIARQSKLVSF